MFPVAASLDFFERGTDSVFHFIKEGGAEGITKESKVKVIDITPEAIITVTAFWNEAMDVGVPFQISAKGRKNHDKTRCEIHGLILFKKHTGNNAVNSVKKAVKERAVMQEKIPELFIDGEDTVAVLNIYQFKGHRGSALHGVEIPAGRAETAMAAEGDKL